MSANDSFNCGDDDEFDVGSITGSNEFNLGEDSDECLDNHDLDEEEIISSGKEEHQEDDSSSILELLSNMTEVDT